MQDRNVGILGIGSYLPPHVRRNDWWPAHHVDSWRQKRINRMTRGAIPADIPDTEGVRLVASEMDRMAADPFDGGVERRVMPDTMSSGDMETWAGEKALADAGVSPKDVDVLLVQSMCPDYLTANNAPAVATRLGLNERVLALETQGVCNGFLLQLDVAQRIIRSGTSRYVLIIQSAPLTRLMDPTEPFSVWFGDGATAALIGDVSPNKGLLSICSRSDGTVQRALVATVDDNRPWWESGRICVRALEPLLGRRMLLTSADLGKQAVDDALAGANVKAADIDFFACHQASAWFRRAAQKLIGLDHTRTVDTFPWTGNLAGANLPLVLEVARNEHLLNDGDLIAMYAGGGGMTWTAGVMRWGR